MFSPKVVIPSPALPVSQHRQSLTFFCVMLVCSMTPASPCSTCNSPLPILWTVFSGFSISVKNGVFFSRGFFFATPRLWSSSHHKLANLSPPPLAWPTNVLLNSGKPFQLLAVKCFSCSLHSLYPLIWRGWLWDFASWQGEVGAVNIDRLKMWPHAVW